MTYFMKRGEVPVGEMDKESCGIAPNVIDVRESNFMAATNAWKSALHGAVLCMKEK